MAMFYNASVPLTSTYLASPWDQGTATLWQHLGNLASSLPPQTPVDAPFVLTPWTATAIVMTFVCGLLANAGGVGGGPFYIPVFNVLLGFDLKASAALSITIVACGALASTLYGLRKTSPRDPNRTLLDFDLALTFLPALLLGVNFGVLFNVLVPEWLQTFLLVFLLYFVIRNTATKARKQWDLERAIIRQRLAAASKAPVIPELAISSIQQPLLEPPSPENPAPGNLGNNNAAFSPGRPSPRRGSWVNVFNDEDRPGGVSHEEAFFPHGEADVPALELPETAVQETHTKTLVQRIPFRQLGALVLLWVLFLVSQGQKMSHNRCSWAYMSILAGQVVVLLGVTGAQILYQVEKARTNIEELDPEMRVILTGENLDEEMEHPVHVLVQVACVVGAAGVGAGLLGLGGAIFFNPWLLHLGVHPQVTVSTAVLMILFSSSAISLSLSFTHLLNLHYALVFAPIAFVASTIGVTVVGRIVRKSGRTSIIVIILTILVAAGTIVTAVFGGLRSYEQFIEGKDIGFHPLCK